MEQPFPSPKRPKKKGRIGRVIAAAKTWLTHHIWDDPPERTRVARALVSYLRVLVLAVEMAAGQLESTSQAIFSGTHQRNPGWDGQGPCFRGRRQVTARVRLVQPEG